MNYLLHFELRANHQEAISDNFVKLKGLIDFPMYFTYAVNIGFCNQGFSGQSGFRGQ